jgi:hypothetical protein
MSSSSDGKIECKSVGAVQYQTVVPARKRSSPRGDGEGCYRAVRVRGHGEQVFEIGNLADQIRFGLLQRGVGCGRAPFASVKIRSALVPTMSLSYHFDGGDFTEAAVTSTIR